MIKLRYHRAMDDVEFTLVPAASVAGLSVRVLGNEVHHYAHGRSHDCMAICAAAADCGAFVVQSPHKMCTFKQEGGKVLLGHEHSEVYIRKAPPLDGITTISPIPPSLPPRIPLAGDEHHRIFLVPKFVSGFEARSLRRFASSCFRERQEQHSFRVIGSEERVSVGAADCPSADAAVLLSRMEERISAITSMRSHEGEESLMFTKLSPVGPRGPWLTNVHHDKNNQERREATVIVYLSSLSEQEGGHTIFPVLSRSEQLRLTSRGSRARTRRSSDGTLASYQDAVRQAFHRGDRAIGCQTSEGSQCAGDEGDVVQHAEAECQRALNGTEQGIAVLPTLGTALVFWSVLPNGTADSAMWHTGCLARAATRGRWVMQKFKSASPADFSTCKRNG